MTAQADTKLHPVEAQWHYPILTRHGYTTDTREARGLVRSYTYTHPQTGHQIECRTGVSADYWIDLSNDRQGSWSALDSYLTERTG